MSENFLKPEHKDYMDAVTFYNKHKLDDAVNLFNACHRRNNKGLYLFLENNTTRDGEVVVKDGLFHTLNHDTLKLPANETLTPFQVFLILQANKNMQAAVMEIERKYMGRDIPYLRVGVDYYKIIKKPDRYAIDREELKRWTKSELVTDYGKKVTELIPKFDDFTIEPNNVSYQPIIKTKTNIYRNLYSKFEHVPAEGSFEWSELLLRHIFGEQYELGVKYMQCLYLMPKQILPILVLASEDRTTGKTTFINWCNQIFGGNATIINPSDLTSDFNGSYASCNVIAIEETMLDKNTSIEKLKSITTAKYISVNRKNIDHHKIPFFGKVIIATNNTRTFARIDDKEIRFWIRQIPEITTRNSDIETNLVNEIPAFLHHLSTLPPIDTSKSRMIFTPEEINNSVLEEVKKESKPTLFKEIMINVIEYFDANEVEEIHMILDDIKKLWFHNKHDYSKNYIKKILVDHFHMPIVPENRYYVPIEGVFDRRKKKGRYYTFSREMFDNIEWNKYSDEVDKPPF